MTGVVFPHSRGAPNVQVRSVGKLRAAPLPKQKDTVFADRVFFYTFPELDKKSFILYNCLSISKATLSAAKNRQLAEGFPPYKMHFLYNSPLLSCETQRALGLIVCEYHFSRPCPICQALLFSEIFAASNYIRHSIKQRNRLG